MWGATMRRFLLLASLCAFASACGGTDDEASAAPVSAGGNPTNGASGSASVGSISDGALGGIMQATIASTSAMAEAAGTRVSNANVRAFVQQLQQDSTNAQMNLAKLMANNDITAASSAQSAQIAAASQAQVAAMAALTDDGFNEGFVESVDEAQTTASNAFTTQFVGVSGNTAVNQFAAGLQKSLEFEAGFANALEGNFDASAFLNAHATTASTVAGGSGQGSVTTDSTTNPGGTGTTPTTGMGTTGAGTTATGAPGIGSGAGEGLGGTGTATGSGQDPGTAVGTGNSSTTSSG